MFRLRFLPQWAAGLVILLGLLTLTGWIFDIGTFKTVFPGLVSMKANTALCLSLAGVSLLLQADRTMPPSQARLSLARFLAGIVTLTALLTLVEYASGLNLGLDQLLFRESSREAGVSFPGRMSPASAVDFILLGTALVTLDVQGRRTRRWPAQYCTFVAAIITLLAFIGYFYGVEALYRVAPYSTIALHTVVAFWLLCLGILFARPDRGALAVFTSSSLGGIIARRMLPAAILVPVLLGWLGLLGERAGLYGLGFGSALLATVIIVTFTALVLWAARALNQAEAERRRGAEALRQSSARLDGIISSAMDAVISVDAQQRVVLFNPAAERMFEINAASALGQHLSRFIPDRLRSVHAQHVEGFGKTGTSSRQMGALGALTALRASGEEFPVEASISQVTVGGERLFTVILRDITERRHAELGLRESERREHARRMELETLMAELNLSRENLRGLAARLQAVREEERTRVAREIHDVLAQELTRIKMDLAWLNRRLAQPPDEATQKLLRAKLAGMLEVADAAISSVQRIATELRPVVLDSLGLCAAIEWQAKDFELRTGIPCTAAVPEGDLPLDRERSTALFRILQESLTNAARHADASRVEIELQSEPGWIRLRVRDDGRGIRPAELSNPRSVGLAGMRERATLLGGQCRIGDCPEGGTAVEACLPLEPQANQTANENPAGG